MILTYIYVSTTDNICGVAAQGDVEDYTPSPQMAWDTYSQCICDAYSFDMSRP